MDWLIVGVLLSAALLAGMILPWVNRARIAHLEREVRALKEQVQRVSLAAGEPVPPRRVALDEVKPVMGATEVSAGGIPAEAVQEAGVETTAPTMADLQVAAQVAVKAPKEQVMADHAPSRGLRGLSIEQLLGARLPVWGGGITLALAVFFLVKYSIEQGLLGPEVRVMLGLAAGGLLLAAGQWLRKRVDITDAVRMAQAVTGAGLAALYVSLFAASMLYHLVPPLVSFAGMAMVTALAIVLAILHGMPIALMALVSGFLTPLLVRSGNPQAPLLFGYLYAVYAGLSWLARRQGWWWLLFPMVGFAWLWVVVWLFSGHVGGRDALWLGLFLLAVSASFVWALEGVSQALAWQQWVRYLRYATLGFAAAAMGWIVSRQGFGMLDWGMFALLSVAGLTLAYLKEALYGWLPWVTLLVNLCLLWQWQQPDAGLYLAEMLGLCGLYGLVAHGAVRGAARPVSWALLGAVAVIGSLFIGYVRQTDILEEWQWVAAVALLAVAVTYGLKQRMHDGLEKPVMRGVEATYAATATALLAMALMMGLAQDYWVLALCLQAAAMAWLVLRLPEVAALRWLVVAVCGVAALVSVPDMLLMLWYGMETLDGGRFYGGWFGTIRWIEQPIERLVLPALLVMAVAENLRCQRDDRRVYGLQFASGVALAMGSYGLVRQVFHMNALAVAKEGMSLLEHGAIHAVWLGLAALGFAMQRYLPRSGWRDAAIWVVVGVMLRCVWFEGMMMNPYFDARSVGEWILVNALTLCYAVPALAVWGMWHQGWLMPEGRGQKWMAVWLFVMGFGWLNLSVRQVFHGDMVHDSLGFTPMEIYSYSVVWLLAGLMLLFAGTLYKHQALRVASLAMMLLTIGKAFLIDASELDGLWRVASFLGLGLSLLGLSWFYGRFVFTVRENDQI